MNDDKSRDIGEVAKEADAGVRYQPKENQSRQGDGRANEYRNTPPDLHRLRYYRRGKR